MAHSAATQMAVTEQPSGPLGLADLVLSASVEFYACVQLLADRARFITGATWAAIALFENKEFVYCAAAGSSAPVIGSAADIKVLQPNKSMGADGKTLVVTVIRESKPAGFFQLVSDAAQFSEYDLQSIVRLAEMVGTAIDHMEAEEHSIAEHSTPVAPALSAQGIPVVSAQVIPAVIEQPKPAVPVLWHAPDGAPSGFSSKSSVGPETSVSVYACESCGFPVSREHTICVDCEERGSPTSMARLFSASEKEQEGWFSAHGYTIASVLVSALAAAIIYWLR
jgi:hypothetical protein